MEHDLLLTRKDGSSGVFAFMIGQNPMRKTLLRCRSMDS
jgi:hypothetical protein